MNTCASFYLTLKSVCLLEIKMCSDEDYKSAVINIQPENDSSSFLKLPKSVKE